MNNSRKKRNLIALLTVQYIAGLLTFNSVSCNCGNADDINQVSSNNIHMQVPSGPFIGNNKTVEVAFTLVDGKQEVDLEGLRLTVTLKEIGGVGSQISYPKATAMTQVNKPLQEVLPLTKLTSATSPCKVPFTLVVTDAFITQIEANFKLVDSADNVLEEGKVTWKATSQPTNLSLTLTTPANLQDDHRTISLLIHNQESEKIAYNQLKLKVTRQEGESAVLLCGSKLLGNQDSYLVGLPMLPGKASLPYELTIIPSGDSQATFNLELIYQGKSIGNPVTVTWKDTQVLSMNDFEYDRTSGKVTCKIWNISSEKVNQIKVSWIAQTQGAQLAKDGKQEIIVGDLIPNEKKRGFELGELQLGNANKSVVFAFTLSYQEKGGRKTMPSVIQTFTKANIDILLDVRNVGIEKLKVAISNDSVTDKAEGLRLIYKNKSVDPKGKLATLDGRQEHIIHIGDLEANQKNTKELTLDLKEAEAATFYFEVQYDNNPIATATEAFYAPRINLELEVLNPKEANDAFILYGRENEIKLSISEKYYSGPIEMKDLQLLIQQVAGDAATISTSPGGPAITAMRGAELGNLKDELTFYVNPATGSKSATFTFQLQHKGKDIDNPVCISWEEYTLWVEGIKDRLIGDEQGRFTVHSNALIDLSTLTAVLESEQGTVFGWEKLDGTMGGVSLPLDQVTTPMPNYYHQTEKQTRYIPFKVKDQNNQKKAKVNVVIKRGTTELTRKEFIWVKQGIDLEIKTSTDLIEPGKEETIIIKNTTNSPLDLRTIQVKHINTAGCPITLGHVSGAATIQQNLAALTGQDELLAQQEVKMAIKLDTKDLSQDKLVAGSMLVFLDSHGEVLQKRYLLFQFLSTIIDEIGYKNDELLLEIENNKDDIGFLVKILLPVEAAVTAFENLPQKLKEITKQDTGYQNLLIPVQKYTTDISNVLNTSRASIQTAISNAVVHQSKEIIVLKKAIKGFKEFIEGEESFNKIVHLLSADYAKYSSMNQQSIKGLYQRYNELIVTFKKYLDQAGIIELKPLPQDLPGIKEVKALYQAMVADLPALEKEGQEGLKAGVEVLKSAITAREQEIQQAIQQKDMDKSYQLLVAQMQWLSALLETKKNLLQNLLGSIVLDGTTWNTFLSASYQNLAEQLLALTTFDEERHLEVTLNSVLETLGNVKQLHQKNPTETTKQATKASTQAAIKIAESLKQKKGENHAVNKKTIQDILQQLSQELTQLQP